VPAVIRVAGEDGGGRLYAESRSHLPRSLAQGFFSLG
jgi:hypothetical protein